MQIALLGPLEVRTDAGEPIEVAGARLRTLLILLALHAGRVVTHRQLIDGLWADDPPATAANALQALVSRLRRALPDGVVQAQPAGYRLAIAPEAVDAARFEALVTRGRSTSPSAAVPLLREAEGLWRDPALADADGAGFALAPRVRLDELRLAAIEQRIGAELALGRPTGPIAAELEALVAAHPLREGLVGLLMRALRAAGRPADALAAFDRARRALADELGTDPTPALAELHLSILRGDGQAPAVEPPRGNLRAALTSFVGRAEEVRKIGKLVAESRLTTLTGPGGAGKTRLAIEAARAVADQARDGVWLVELAPVADPAEVPQAVVVALDVRDQAKLGNRRLAPVDDADPLVRLTSALEDRDLLIVLDNCEHLIDASARLADQVLGRCPGVRILATSREQLGITGEVVLPVEPLPTPPPGHDDVDYPAMRLLIDRASAVRPGFVVDAAVGSALARICRALDGMPLAIELAAARLSALTPQQVADRLDDRFQLLTKGSRTALPRHQTLRAVVDWSWELLDDDERRLLRRLAIFAGGATIDAAERVCGGAVDGLAMLADKSLLVPDGDRFRMLETIRAYGLERLREAGEHEELERAHTAYFLDLAERAEPLLRTASQLDWLRRLGDEHDNLQAALRRAVAAGDAATATRFVAALGWYWWLRGHRADSADLVIQALEVPGAVADERRALACAYTVLSGFDSGRDTEELKMWAGRAVALQEQLHSTHPVLQMIHPIATLAFEGPATGTLEQDLMRLFDNPDPWTRSVGRLIYAHTQMNLGRSPADAREHFDVALAGFRALGERWGLAFTLTALAEQSAMLGEHRTSIASYEEALVYIRELGVIEDRPYTEARYAFELYVVGERQRADAALDEAQRTAERIGQPDGVGYTLHTRAEFARHDGELDRAAAINRQIVGLLAGRRISPQLNAVANSAIAMLETQRGDLAGADQHHRKALEHAMESHDAPIVGAVVVGLAALALAKDDPARAATLLAAADAIRGAPDATRLDAPRIRAAVLARLGEARFAEASEKGRHATIESLPDPL